MIKSLDKACQYQQRQLELAIKNKQELKLQLDEAAREQRETQRQLTKEQQKYGILEEMHLEQLKRSGARIIHHPQSSRVNPSGLSTKAADPMTDVNAVLMKRKKIQKRKITPITPSFPEVDSTLMSSMKMTNTATRQPLASHKYTNSAWKNSSIRRPALQDSKNKILRTWSHKR